MFKNSRVKKKDVWYLKLIYLSLFLFVVKLSFSLDSAVWSVLFDIEIKSLQVHVNTLLMAC